MKMSKLAASLLAAGVLGVSGAAAEGRSFFVGGGYNFHSIERSYEYSAPIFGNVYHGYIEEDASGSGISLVVGTTMMTSANSGVRGYLNYDVNFVKIKYEGTSKTDSGKYHIIGFNSDWLYNFQPNFGIFVGANIGVISWDKKLWSLYPKTDDSLTKFYLAGQFGGRFMLGEGNKHAIEIVAKIPFTTQKIEYTYTTGAKAEVKIGQSVSAGIRYAYSF